MERYVSLFGLFVMVLLAWLMSSHKRKFPWRIVISGIILQFVFAILILKTRPGEITFEAVGAFFTTVLDSVDEGSKFVFGPEFKNYFFAFKILPTIIFCSALMSVLYYMGLMQIVVKALAWLMQRTLGTSAAETLSSSANVFMGQTEAPLLVRPFIPTMTQSELNAVMVGGFATISGSLLAALVGMEISAAHLVTASVISAPAGLLIAKVLVPETEEPTTLGAVTIAVPQQGANIIEAAAIGASEGMKLAINVAAMLLAFLALVALIDKGVGVLGAQFGMQWSLTAAFGYAFAPLAWLMGIEASECVKSGELLGMKMAINEFYAYQELSKWIKPDSGVQLSERTITILTYALCGFSNFGSIGIQIGGLGAMAPERQADLARLGLRAMLGGTLACCMTACVAGVIL